MKVEINHNKAKRGIELRFESKVEGELKEQLRVAGFNYSEKYNCYWAAYTEGLMKYVVAMQEALERGENKAIASLQPSYKPTEENLERRNYSYVSIFYLEKGNTETSLENYLLFEPKKNLAWLIAWDFARKAYGEKLRQLMVEPRNYVKKARTIFSKNFETNIIGLDAQEKEIKQEDKLVPIKGKENKIISVKEKENISAVNAEENKSSFLKERENTIDANEKENKTFPLKGNENLTAVLEQESKSISLKGGEITKQNAEQNAEQSKLLYRFLQPYSGNYKRLKRLIPNLEEHLELETLFGKSQLKNNAFMDLSYDFLGKDSDGKYHIALAHYFEKNGDLVPDPDMEIRIDAKMKTAEALHYQDQFGYRPVYVEKEGKTFVNTKEKKDQNYFLGKWLSNALKQGHQIILKKEKEDEQESCIGTLLEFQPLAMAKLIAGNIELKQYWKWAEETLEKTEFSNGELIELERLFHQFVCQDSILEKEYAPQVDSRKEAPAAKQEDLNAQNENQNSHSMKVVSADEGIAEKIEREDFIENLKVNIWDLIPQEDKKQQKIKNIDWKADPKDDGLQKLVAGFVSHDELREAILGVYFDENGIVATDAYKLLFLKTEQKKIRGIYCMSPSCWKNIRNNVKDGEGLTEMEKKKAEEYRKGKRGMYPNYQSVVNIELKEIYSVDEEGLYTYVKTLKKVKLIKSKDFEIILQAGEMLVGVNGDFLEVGIRTMLSLGHKELEIGIVAPDKPIILAPVGEMDKVRTLESDFVLLMPAHIKEEKIKDGKLVKGCLYYDLEKMQPLTSGIDTIEKEENLPVKSEVGIKQKNQIISEGKLFIRNLNSRGVDVPNVLMPDGVEEPFASQDFYIGDMQETLKNKFSDLLEITESEVSELGPIEMFELMQFAHPTDYGIEVSRSAMLEEWEKRGEELFKQLGYPIDEDYPYVNIHTGYSSIGTLGKILDSKFSKQWWAVIQGYRPVADLQAAIVYVQEKIKEGEEEKKQHLNSSTGKPLGKSKEALRDVDWKISRLKGGLEVVQEYLKKKGNPYGQIEKWTSSEAEKKIVPKRKTQLSLNEEIEDFIVTRDNEGGGKYSVGDKQYIAQYTGSGGLIKQGAQGKGILYEYYTPEDIVRKMWGLAYKYGYHAGRVLEPACGTGNFLKYAPMDASVTGYEINPTAVRIVEILYPQVKVYQKPFETIFFIGNIHLKGKYAGEKYDLIIGNPPYGDFSGKWAGMGEKQYTGATEYDQYFILRGLEMLNPGGLLVFIIPSVFLQNASKYNKIKQRISQLAILVDAYRLPTGVFNTTDIGTDIVVFSASRTGDHDV